MPQYSRNVVILGKLEVTYGVYNDPSNTDAILAGSNWSITHDVSKINRDLLRAYMGAMETVPGAAFVQLQFTTEMAGSGAAITEPAWSGLLKIAGFSGALTAAVKWDYTPISDGFPSMSLQAYFAGTKISVRGARVMKCDIDMSVNGIPMMTWTIIGIENNPYSEIALPTPTFTAWKRPLVLTDANSADIRFGSTYSAATGALSGGTAFRSKGLKLGITNNCKGKPFLGGDVVLITQREITGEMTLDLEPADRVAFYTAFKANTTSSVSFGIGTAAGSIVRLFMPAVERNDPQNIDDDGQMLMTYSIRARPNTGNDELRFVTL